jgi:hypothetical protein
MHCEARVWRIWAVLKTALEEIPGGIYMTPASFLRAVLALWGEDWRPGLTKLLAKHGHRRTRQTLWNWKMGKTPVPEHVELILAEERKARKSAR